MLKSRAISNRFLHLQKNVAKHFSKLLGTAQNFFQLAKTCELFEHKIDKSMKVSGIKIKHGANLG